MSSSESSSTESSTTLPPANYFEVHCYRCKKFHLITLDFQQNMVMFCLKRTTKFIRLMDAFKRHVGEDFSNLIYFYKGRQIKVDDTPMKLNMEDGNFIVVYSNDTGWLTNDQSAVE